MKHLKVPGEYKSPGEPLAVEGVAVGKKENRATKVPRPGNRRCNNQRRGVRREFKKADGDRKYILPQKKVFVSHT